MKIVNGVVTRDGDESPYDKAFFVRQPHLRNEWTEVTAKQHKEAARLYAEAQGMKHLRVLVVEVREHGRFEVYPKISFRVEEVMHESPEEIAVIEAEGEADDDFEVMYSSHDVLNEKMTYGQRGTPEKPHVYYSVIDNLYYKSVGIGARTMASDEEIAEFLKERGSHGRTD